MALDLRWHLQASSRRRARRRSRRASPVSRRLVEARRCSWRTNRRDVLVHGAFFAVLGTVLALLCHGHPLLVGLVLGNLATMFVGATWVVLNLGEGVGATRLSRLYEEDAAEVLARLLGSDAVETNVPFHGLDVDVAAVLPSGILGVEVKTLLGGLDGRPALDGVWALDDKLRQAASRAGRLHALALSCSLRDVPVVPVLLLTGKGAPILDAVQRRGDVFVATTALLPELVAQLAGRPVRLEADDRAVLVAGLRGRKAAHRPAGGARTPVPALRSA